MSGSARYGVLGSVVVAPQGSLVARFFLNLKVFESLYV